MKALGFRAELHIEKTVNGEEERLDIHLPGWAARRPAIVTLAEGAALLFYLLRGERGDKSSYPSARD